MLTPGASPNNVHSGVIVGVVNIAVNVVWSTNDESGVLEAVDDNTLANVTPGLLQHPDCTQNSNRYITGLIIDGPNSFLDHLLAVEHL